MASNCVMYSLTFLTFCRFSPVSYNRGHLDELATVPRLLVNSLFRNSLTYISSCFMNSLITKRKQLAYATASYSPCFSVSVFSLLIAMSVHNLLPIRFECMTSHLMMGTHSLQHRNIKRLLLHLLIYYLHYVLLRSPH